MLISVILPTHNRPHLLLEAINSVEQQTWTNWELIVIDDGSEPPIEIESEICCVGRVKFLRNQPAAGLSNARNRGMETACGDIITFLDDDDLLSAETLEKIAQAFLQNPELECLFINILPFGMAGKGMQDNQNISLEAALKRAPIILKENNDRELLIFGDGLFSALLEGLPLAFQRVALRRDLLSRTGLYQPGAFGDLEWNYRLTLRCKCALLITPLYKVRCDGQSFFTRDDAEEKLLDAAIRIRQQLTNLEEVKSQPFLDSKVRLALAKANFDKAYFAYTSSLRFPWEAFFQSTKGGIGWRHVSILIKFFWSRVSNSK
jgi:glycosyltransferase involved in cell wall biosynthesis